MTPGAITPRPLLRFLGPVVAVVLAVAGIGCPPGEPPPFDFSNLTDARFGEAYSGQIYLEDYDGPAVFTEVGGELPPGLTLNEAGQVTGTPEYLGTFTFEVLASGLSSSPTETFGTVALTVVAVGETLDALFIGYEHDQFNNMTERLDLMRDIWLRVTGGGIQGDGVNSWTMNPGLYLPGPNGFNDGGDVDDQRVGDMDFSDLEIAFSAWQATGPVEPNPPSYPSAHVPEDDPPSIGSDGTFRSGADGGEAEVVLSHPDYPGNVERRVLIVPPDWCPVGEDYDGGPGGWSATRYCEGPRPEPGDDD